MPTKIVSIALCLFLLGCCFSAVAQTSTTTPPLAAALPNNAAFAGMGFQSTGSPQVSGFMEACHRNPDITLLGLTLPSYLCGATDYSGNVTSARVDINTVLFAGKGFAGGSKSGGGAGFNASGVGASYAVGGWATADLSKFLKIDGAKLAASITWQKDDVSIAVQNKGLPDTLRQLAARATARFGFGKTW